MEIHEATAVYVFDPAFERLLFIRHRKPPLAGMWLPPGGHVDPGESPDAAALREVREETGQDVVLIDMTPGFPLQCGPRVRRIVSPLLVQLEDLGDHQHLDFVYVAVAPSPGALVTEPDQPAAWFDAAEAASEQVLVDCRAHAAHLFAEREAIRARYAAQIAQPIA